MHYHGGFWCWLALALSPLWKVEITGKEHLDRKTPHVVIMNHQSLIDILIAFRLFYPVKMIGKKILAFVPIIGWNLFLSGHLMVDRKNMKSQFKAIRKLEALIAPEIPFWCFPREPERETDCWVNSKKEPLNRLFPPGHPSCPW